MHENQDEFLMNPGIIMPTWKDYEIKKENYTTVTYKIKTFLNWLFKFKPNCYPCIKLALNILKERFVFLKWNLSWKSHRKCAFKMLLHSLRLLFLYSRRNCQTHINCINCQHLQLHKKSWTKIPRLLQLPHFKTFSFHKNSILGQQVKLYIFWYSSRCSQLIE